MERFANILIAKVEDATQCFENGVDYGESKKHEIKKIKIKDIERKGDAPIVEGLLIEKPVYVEVNKSCADIPDDGRIILWDGGDEKRREIDDALRRNPVTIHYMRFITRYDTWEAAIWKVGLCEEAFGRLEGINIIDEVMDLEDDRPYGCWAQLFDADGESLGEGVYTRRWRTLEEQLRFESAAIQAGRPVIFDEKAGDKRLATSLVRVEQLNTKETLVVVDGRYHYIITRPLCLEVIEKLKTGEPVEMGKPTPLFQNDRKEERKRLRASTAQK